jgi:hypothetical protein
MLMGFEMLTRTDMTCIVCGNTQVAGLAGWHATCPPCNYESAALSVAINAHSGPAVDEAEREAGLKALRLENFRTIVSWARRHVGVSRPRLLDVGSAHGWFLETAREQFDVLGVEPDAVVGAAPRRAACRCVPATSRTCSGRANASTSSCSTT